MSDNNISKSELLAKLLNAYKETDDEVSRIKAQLEEANKRRSDRVKELHDSLGKGPYSLRGEYLGKIVIRGNTYFFRGAREDNILKVD